MADFSFNSAEDDDVPPLYDSRDVPPLYDSRDVPPLYDSRDVPRVLRQPNIRAINQSKNKSTVVISIVAHGSFNNIESNVDKHIDDIPDSLNTNVVVLSFSPANTVLYLYKNNVSYAIHSIKDLLKTNIPVIDIFKTIRQEDIEQNKQFTANNIDAPTSFLKLLNPSVKDVIDKTYYANNVFKKRGMQIYKPHTNMDFESNELDNKWPNDHNGFENANYNDPTFYKIDIQILDVRYPHNGTQIDLLNMESNTYKDFYNKTVTINGRYQDSSLSKIIYILKNDFGFNNVFIVLIACRKNEFNTNYATQMVNEHNNKFPDYPILSRDDDQLNTLYKNRDKRKLWREKRDNPMLTTLGGKKSKRRRTRCRRRRFCKRKTRRTA
jgi:hypothetical protein